MDPAKDELVNAVAPGLQVAVMRLARRLRGERTEGLTASQLSVLGVLVRMGPHAMSDLAAAERVKAPSMTKTVAALVRAGLVEKGQDPGDARVVLVSATAAGHEAVLRIRQARREWLTARLAGLEPDELDVLRRASEILLEVAQR